MGWRCRTVCIALFVAGIPGRALADPGEFTLHEVTSAGEPINSLRRAYRLLGGQLAASSSSDFSEPLVNFMTPGDFRSSRFSGTVPFPSADSNPSQKGAVQITGQVEVPTAGKWSFGITGTEGARLFINGKAVRDAGGRSPRTRMRTINFDHAGVYSLQLTYFQRRGPDELELFSSPGSFRRFHARGSNFQLVGDFANGGLSLQPLIGSVGGAVGGGTSGGDTGGGTTPVVGGGNTGGLPPVVVGPTDTISEPDTTGTGLFSTGDETWNGGGTYLWKINDLAGAPGAPDGWDELNMPTLTVASVTSTSKFTIKLRSFSGNIQGTPAGLGNDGLDVPHVWTIAHSDTAASINSQVQTAPTLLDPALFALDTSEFTVDGVSIPSADFQLQLVNGTTVGQDLQLIYTPTPEPATALLVGIGGLPLLAGRRRSVKR